MSTPGLRERGKRATGVALLLHGGRARSHEPATRANLTYQRMVPFARDLARHGRRHGLLVAQLSYRYRGWNAPDLDPVTDTRWALDQLRDRHGELPVVLVGHSMGGRAALHAADDRDVLGVCALAPWTEPGEPVARLAGKSLLIAHGDRERWTDPRLSYEYAVRARPSPRTSAGSRCTATGTRCCAGHANGRDWSEVLSLVAWITNRCPGGSRTLCVSRRRGACGCR